MVIGFETTGCMNQNPTGIALYSREIMRSVAELDKAEIYYFYKLSRLKNHNQRLPSPNNRWYMGAFAFNTRKLDIAHTLDNHFLNLPKCRKIVTIHDLAPAKPDNQMEGYSIKNARELILAKIEYLNKNVDSFIAVSNTTKKDLIELCNVPESKIKVIHLAPVYRKPVNDEASIFSQYQLKSKQYLLFVGSISIRKNILNLIHGYTLGRFNTDYELVLAGGLSMGADKITALIHQYGLQDRIKILGYVPDKYVNTLYKHSKAFLFPTYYEGFGIPIVEAMLHGVPVLIGNRGASPEIADGNAVEVDPFSVDSIAYGISTVIEQPTEAIEKAKLHAQQFTWARTANETMEYYREIIGD